MSWWYAPTAKKANRKAMAAGILAAAIPGMVQITAGNYGGNLGKVKYPLYEILREEAGL